MIGRSQGLLIVNGAYMICSVSSYLRTSAEMYAKSIAVSDGKNSLSYCDLLANAEKIASAFAKKNIFKKRDKT